MKSEKKIICVRLIRKKLDVRGAGAPHLDTNRQRGKAVSNIRGSPELRPVNDATCQRAKLYKHVQLSGGMTVQRAWDIP